MEYKNIENALLQGATLSLWDRGRGRTRKNPQKFQPAVGITYHGKNIGYGTGETISEALDMCNNILCMEGLSEAVITGYKRRPVQNEDFELDLEKFLIKDGSLSAKCIDGIIHCSISTEMVLDVERQVEKCATGTSISSAIHSALQAKYLIQY